MSAYTKRQREANDLDMDMHRMVGRLLAFGDGLPPSQRGPLQRAAAELSEGRSAVRAHMHPTQRRETE